MVANQKKYLNLISLNLLESWSVQSLLDKKVAYNKKYELAKIGDFLIKSRDIVNIEDGEEYRRVTVKIRNGGVTLRDIEKGENIGTKKQYRAKAGQFIVSKIDARNGAFGIIPSELDGAVVTNDFPLFTVNEKAILSQFLVLITTTKEFIKFAQSCSSGTTNRQRMDIDLFLQQKIPLPSLEEQERIVTAYQTRIQEAETLEKEVNDLEGEIERYLFEHLGVIKNKKVLKLNGLNFVNYSELSIWGADRLLRGGNQSLLHSSIYPNIKLSSVCLINPRTDISLLKENDEMSFIPMECISDERGEVIELRKGKKLNSSGYTKFQEGDLIWARITPCMQNGKSAIVKGLENSKGYGSTEFHVIRSNNEGINLDYVHLLLRTKSILNDATNYFTGSAGQQRVPKSYLEDLIIPMPSITVQTQIVQYLHNLKEQIKLKKENSEEQKSRAERDFEQEIFGVS